MRIIVPLAGPDFVSEQGEVKAMIPTDSGPLLKCVLQSRPWAGVARPEDYVFVFRDLVQTRDFVASTLRHWYPGARYVFLSDCTRGAALTCLAALSLCREPDEPVIVDLADIDYHAEVDVYRIFKENPRVGAIAITFSSDDPAYSYLRRDADGKVVEAAEKRVISNEASAGTYIFRSAPLLLRAIAHSLENESVVSYNALLFVCPLFNGVLDEDWTIATHGVSSLIDLKTGVRLGHRR